MRKGFGKSLLKRKLKKKQVFDVSLRKLNGYKRYKSWLVHENRAKGLFKAKIKSKKSKGLRFIKR